jgi:hypothetical protein
MTEGTGTAWLISILVPPSASTRTIPFTRLALLSHETGTPTARRIAFSISSIRCADREPPIGRGASRSRRNVVICSHFATEG